MDFILAKWLCINPVIFIVFTLPFYKMNVMLCSSKCVLGLTEHLEIVVNLPEETLGYCPLPMLPLISPAHSTWGSVGKRGPAEPGECSWWAREVWPQYTACMGVPMKTALLTISSLSIPQGPGPGACSSPYIISSCMFLPLTTSLYTPTHAQPQLVLW